MTRVALWLWQFPQHLVALVLIALWHAKPVMRESNRVNRAATKAQLAPAKDWRFFWTAPGRFGLSLGNYRFVNADFADSVLRHEYGHSRQSRRLGWLYLPLIGLPSVVGFVLHDKLKLRFSYYRQPWEAWADRLGGVKRP